MVMNVVQPIHIVPILTSVQKTSTYTAPHINMKLYNRVEFLVHMGAIEGDDFDITVTQSAVTAGSSSTPIAAKYRLSAAAGTDTMGDVTTLSTDGFTTIDGVHEDMVLIIDVKSSDLTTASKPYVGLKFTDTNGGDVVFGIIALCWPKYPMETNASALT